VLLADADAFYVAVARLVDPGGAGREPLLIVGGTRGSRGVVCSASYEARAFGVRSAMPIAQAVRLCPRAMCVPIPRGACGEKSAEIRRVLERWAPVVEGASIDEWYLDLAGTEALYGKETLAGTAQRIRRAVLRETGLAISLGGGTSKLIAKLAVELAKPKGGAGGTGVHVVEPGTEGAFMRRFTLAELPMIGPRFQARLAGVGLARVEDVLPHDERALAKWLGEREARWLYDRVRGIDERAVAVRDMPVSMSREDTFPEDLTSEADLERELLRLVVRAASDLRGESLTARTITVKLRDFDFRTRQGSRTLPRGVVADRVIFGVARELLRKLRRARRAPARLLGVSLSSFAGDADGAQLALFEDASPETEETSRDRAIARIVDALRERFGERAILPGGLAR